MWLSRNQKGFLLEAKPKGKLETIWGTHFLVNFPILWFYVFPYLPDTMRLIGRKFDDPVFRNDMKYWPFSFIPDKQGCPKMVEVNDRSESKTFFPEVITIINHFTIFSLSKFLPRFSPAWKHRQNPTSNIQSAMWSSLFRRFTAVPNANPSKKPLA